jgi:hypothetical protein
MTVASRPISTRWSPRGRRAALPRWRHEQARRHRFGFVRLWVLNRFVADPNRAAFCAEALRRRSREVAWLTLSSHTRPRGCGQRCPAHAVAFGDVASAVLAPACFMDHTAGNPERHRHLGLGLDDSGIALRATVEDGRPPDSFRLDRLRRLRERRGGMAAACKRRERQKRKYLNGAHVIHLPLHGAAPPGHSSRTRAPVGTGTPCRKTRAWAWSRSLKRTACARICWVSLSCSTALHGGPSRPEEQRGVCHPGTSAPLRQRPETRLERTPVVDCPPSARSAMVLRRRPQSNGSRSYTGLRSRRPRRDLEVVEPVPERRASGYVARARRRS